MRYKISFLVIITLLVTMLAGCGMDIPTTGGGTPGPMPIHKFIINGTTITPSASNPFSGQVSVPGFAAASTAIFITIPESAVTTTGFSESLSTSVVPTYNAMQAAAAPISGSLLQATSPANNTMTGEEVFRQAELNIAKRPGLSSVKSSGTGLLALGAAGPDVVGTVNPFWVNATGDSQLTGDVQITATCKYVGPHSYIYVDNATPNIATTYTAANLLAISNAWEAIYTADRAAFGSEATPPTDIDNDVHITILISPAVNNYGGNNVLGYFFGKDEWAVTANGSQTDHSNQREMFYVIDTPRNSVTSLWADAATTAANAKQGYTILAHEFQHMINYNQKVLLHYNPATGQSVFEQTWLNEALSMYAMQVCGYSMPQGDTTTVTHVKNYLTTPNVYSLTLWNPGNGGYGASYLFMLYLVEHYSGGAGQPTTAAMLQGMESNALSGIANIESVTGAGTFPTVMRNWAIANVLDKKTTNPLYNYTSISLYSTYGTIVLSGAQPAATVTTPQNLTASQIKGWSAIYQKFTLGNGTSFNLSATSNNIPDGLIGILIVQ